MFIRRTDGPVLSRQLYGVRPDVDVKVFRREKFACFQTMHDHPVGRGNLCALVHSCTLSGDMPGGRIGPCNRRKRRKNKGYEEFKQI